VTGVQQDGPAERGGRVNQPGRDNYNADRDLYSAGRDLFDIDVHSSSLSPAAAKATRSKPLVVPQRRVSGDRLRGRDALVSGLMAAAGRAMAGSPGHGQVWVLHGMGGCGKTTVAMEVAHQARDAGMRTWWVSATVAEELEAALTAVAFDAGASEMELARGHPADALWRHLDGAAQPWLLVIDNADDLDLLTAQTGRLADGRGWLRSPATGTGLVLVTSRDGAQTHWGSWARLEPVPVLDAVEGGQVLRDLAPQAGDRSQSEALCSWLGGLPLALDLAGSYLAASAASLWPQPGAVITFDGYRELLEDREDQLGTLGTDTHASPEEQARRKLTTTWELSLNLLEDRGLALARPLLRLLSCWAPAPVPYTAVLDPDLLAASPLFRDATRDELARSLEGLARLGLVTIDSATSPNVNAQRTALLPPLVRATNRIHPDIETRSGQYQDLMIALIEGATNRYDIDDSKNWRLWNLLVPHCRALIDFAARPASASPGDWSARLTGPAFLAGVYLRRAGFYAQAIGVQQEVTALRRNALGESHPATLASRQQLALAWRDGGLWAESHAEYRAVLALRTRVLGKEHPDTMETRHGLASVLRREGFLDQAQAEYRAVLALRSRILGDEHPDTLATRQNLAFVLQVREQDRAAESEYRSILEAQRRALGENHPQTIATQQNIATILQSQGRLDEADAEYHAVLELRRKEFGEDHPDTLTTRHAIAYMLRLRGQHEAAEAEYRAVIERQVATLGDEHPAAVGTRHNLAGALQAQGRLEEAEAEYGQVLAIRRRTLGDDNPDTLDTRHAAAYLLKMRGQYAAAEAEYRVIIAHQRAMAGDRHPTTLGTRHNLAVVLHDQGRLDEAEDEYADVLAIRSEVLGDTHHDTVDTRRNLAAVRGLRPGTRATGPGQPGC
jgi:tetratricopeptide (TPR) repeat protein